METGKGRIMAAKWGKGDRVQFVDRHGKRGNVIKYGVVSRGGSKRVTVVLDGGKYEVKGHPACFHGSDKPLPVDVDNPMSRWTISKWREIPGHGDSRTFNATICKDGVAVVSAENNGWGGSNMYHDLPNGQLGEGEASWSDLLRNDAAAAAKQFGYPGMFEPVDSWVEWYQYARPFGVTFQAEVERTKAQFAEWERHAQAAGTAAGKAEAAAERDAK